MLCDEVGKRDYTALPTFLKAATISFGSQSNWLVCGDAEEFSGYCFDAYHALAKSENKTAKVESGIVKPATISNTLSEEFGIYYFWRSKNKTFWNYDDFYIQIRSADGLWLKRVFTDDDEGNQQSFLAFQHGWIGAAAFNLAQLSFNYDSSNLDVMESDESKIVDSAGISLVESSIVYKNAHSGGRSYYFCLLKGAEDLTWTECEEAGGRTGETRTFTGVDHLNEVTTVNITEVQRRVDTINDDFADAVSSKNLSKYQQNKFKQLKNALTSIDQIEYPNTPRAFLIESLSDDELLAFGDIIKIISSFNGVEYDEYEVGFTHIYTHHISRARLELTDANIIQLRVLDLIEHFVDIRQNLDNYIDRARDFMQGHFALQQNIIREITSLLDVKEIKRRGKGTSALPTILAFGKMLNSTPGITIQNLGFFISVVNFAMKIYSGVKVEGKSITYDKELSNETLLIESIGQDFLNISYALDHARQTISANSASLCMWRDANPRWVGRTEQMDDAVNRLFRSEAWVALLPHYCKVVRETVSSQVYSSWDFDLSSELMEANRAAKAARDSDRSVLAFKVYYFQAPIGEYYCSLVKYSLKHYSGEGLSDAVFDEIYVKQGMSPKFVVSEALSINVDNSEKIWSGFQLLGDGYFLPTSIVHCNRTSLESLAYAINLGNNS